MNKRTGVVAGALLAALLAVALLALTPAFVVLALLPDAQFERRPDLSLLRGCTLFPHFDFDGMVTAMRSAADAYRREGREQEAALARAYACVGMESSTKVKICGRWYSPLPRSPISLIRSKNANSARKPASTNSVTP